MTTWQEGIARPREGMISPTQMTVAMQEPNEPRNLGSQHLSLEELDTWPEHKLCSHL